MEHIDSKDKPYLDNMLRLSYTIFKLIQDVHNFKMLVYHTNIWGVKINGSWHGAIGFLVRQEVDICLSPLRWSIDRFGIYDETTYIYTLRYLRVVNSVWQFVIFLASIYRQRFVFRHPRISENNSNKLMEPFHFTIWIYTGLGSVVFIIFLQLTFFVEQYKNVRVKPLATYLEGNVEYSWSQSILVVYGILFQQSIWCFIFYCSYTILNSGWPHFYRIVFVFFISQGFSIKPQLSSSRIALLAFLFFSVLFFQFYSSFIVGSLLTKPAKTLRTIKQLLDSDIECGLDKVAYNKDIFENVVGNPIARKLYFEKVAAPKNYIDLWDGIMRIKKGGFAFNTDYSSGYMIVEGDN